MHIYISAGESSGDLLGANLAIALLEKNPTLKLTGMGSQRMKDAGVSIVVDAEKLSFVGIVEILGALPSIFATWHVIKQYLKKEKPDLIIFIDLPDTHIRLSKYAKKLGIPVFYYVSPQIWAWRYSRIHKIKKYVNHMAVLFAFEEKIYRDAGIPVTFVGHPLANIAKASMSKDEAYSFFKLNPNQPIVALFPGSRHSELKNHLSVIIESSDKIRTQKPETQFVLVLASRFNPSDITVPSYIKIVQDNLYNLLLISDAAIAVSGTVTLEIGIMAVPLCVIYRANALSAWIGRRLIKTPYMALCNIVAEKMIVKELLQEQVTAETISTEIVLLLNDKNYHTEKTKALLHTRASVENNEGFQQFLSHIHALS